MDTVVINQQYFREKCGRDFIEQSPHLKHPSLARLCGEIATEAFQHVNSGMPSRVLDMGAGDGALTIPYLNLGAQVVAADASDELLQRLRERAKAHGSTLTILTGDIFETLERLQAENSQFDIVCASSFLHHIPDYLRLCQCAAPLVRRGGVFFTFQDPLRYDTLGRAIYAFDRMSYFWWRLFQGNYVRGIKTRIRRLTGNFRDDLAEDTAEYHVVRNGVDQLALKQIFDSAGFDCSIRAYWSTQSTLFQHLGKKLKLANTFAIIAQKKA